MQNCIEYSPQKQTTKENFRYTDPEIIGFSDPEYYVDSRTAQLYA